MPTSARAAPTAAGTARRRCSRSLCAANRFDIRRIIGGPFLLYGIVLTVLGFDASEADMRRADGVNVNLAVGIALLIVASLFIAWALLRPLRRELEEADAADAPDAGGGERRFERGEQAANRPQIAEMR